MSFLILGCTEDEFINSNSEDAHQVDNGLPTLEKVSFDQFLSTSNFEASYEFQDQSTTTTQSTNDSNYYDVSLDKINQVSKGQTISYTFLIEGKIDDSSAFDNFMIKEDPNGDLSYYIIAYTENASGSSFPYSAVTKPIDESDMEYTTNAIRLKVMPIDEGGGGSGDEDLPSSPVGSPYYPYNCDGTVIMYYATVSLCNCCNHLPRECNGCDKGWHDVVVPYYYCESHDDGGENNGGGNDGGSGDGNDGGTPPAGGGGDSQESPTISSPNHDITVEDPEDCPGLEGDLNGDCILDYFEAFVLGLDSDQISWWNDEASETQKIEIEAFLENNKESGVYTQEAKAFAEAAIKAWRENNGADVDFAYQVIVDDSFKQNECLMDVYEAMGEAPTFDGYLKNFDSEMSVANLTFTTGVHPLYPDATAVTDGPQNYLIQIMFNTNKLNRPSLDVARTFIHEMIHSEMYRLLLSKAQTPEIPWSKQFIESMENDYPGLYDYYMRYYYDMPNGVPLGDPMHEMMAQHYRTIIENALREYDNSYPDDVYEALSWVGLKGKGNLDASTGLTPSSTKAWEAVPLSERLYLNQKYEDFNEQNPNCQ